MTALPADRFVSLLGASRGNAEPRGPLPVLAPPPVTVTPLAPRRADLDVPAVFARWAAHGPGGLRAKAAEEALGQLTEFWISQVFETERARTLHLLDVCCAHPDRFDFNPVRAAQPDAGLCARAAQYVRAGFRAAGVAGRPFGCEDARAVVQDRIVREFFGELAVRCTVPWQRTEDTQAQLRALLGDSEALPAG